MAEVWAARMRGTRGFQKLVAVKTILPGVIDSVRLEEMFLEEAQLASQIHHPNVVTTLDLGEHEGSLYLVMEWVDGEPLSAVMSAGAKCGGVPLDIAVNLMGQACKGLHAAHSLKDEDGAQLGVVHRDVSPQNLLVTLTGTAKLVDFGIAKATSKISSLTEAGEVKGKFAYMAPEQVRGGAVDCRTDLFALGIVLYGITTGKHPFRGAHPAETIRNICDDAPPKRPSALVPGYPFALENVVMKALQKSPDARFEDANDMLRALEDAMPGPLEASFETTVADYMASIFSVRSSERRTAIRVAQEQADRERTESSLRTAGTMHALSNGNDEGASAFRAVLRTRTPRWAVPLAAVGIVAACGAITVGSLRSAHGPPLGGPTPSGAPGLAPSVAPGRLAPSVSAARPEPAAEVTADATSEAAPVEIEVRKGTARTGAPSRGAPGRRAPNAPNAPSTASAAAAGAPAAVSAAPAVATPAAQPTAPNAWDRNQFGGRF